MKTPLAYVMLVSHRVVFIAATVALAVGTSNLASQTRGLSDWLIVLGGATLMYSTDALGQMEASAQLLSRASRRGDLGIHRARSAMFRRGQGVLLTLAWLAGWLALVGAIVAEII
jgi:hypothetical protein